MGRRRTLHLRIWLVHLRRLIVQPHSQGSEGGEATDGVREGRSNAAGVEIQRAARERGEEETGGAKGLGFWEEG